jgi:hypothetical protein
VKTALLSLLCLVPLSGLPLHAATNDWFGIRVVDESTGRGVPLVELETVNHLRYVTDNAGWVALQEPGWAGQPVFFTIRSHGYEYPKDGFGYAGVAVTNTPGAHVTVKLKRHNVAERLYRVTGEGRHRDSVLLGEPAPAGEPAIRGLVVGQDSVQLAPYHGRLLWFWGDTARLRHPLGQFRTSGAWSVLPGAAGFDPTRDIDLHYWTDREGFSREMVPLPTGEKGVVWIDGVVTVPDAKGQERLVAHFSHRESLARQLRHGFAVWNDGREAFEPTVTLPEAEVWRFLQGHPVKHTMAGREYLLCGDHLPNIRVPARLEDVLNPASYEAWTCLSTNRNPQRDAAGALSWAWQRDTAPTRNRDEQRWLKAGLVQTNELRFLPLDTESGKTVLLHGGSVRWNAHRQRWIAIAVESGGTSSALGEVWYAEARDPLGPWRKARRVVTHERYSFYNPVHHDVLDREGGRLIQFEGTYAETFSGNPTATPRYDYNQMMYRLDLDDPRLAATHE